ncbi:MAG: O-antigen ligase family protein, partial [Acidobacteriota bacterium]
MRAICYGAVIGVPIVIQMGASDGFRLPKELAVRGAAIFLSGLLTIALIRGDLRLPTSSEIRRPVWLTCGAILLWSVVCGLAAENRRVVPPALAWIGIWLLLFAVAYYVARIDRSNALLVVATIPAIVNAVMLLLQASHVWNPFAAAAIAHDRTSYIALLGNPDDVGGVLVPAAVLTVVLALTTRSWLASLGAVIVIGAVIASQTITAIVALFGSMLLLAMLATRRRFLVVSVLLLCGLASLAYPPLRSRASAIVQQGRGGDFNAMLSNRITVFAAAAQMFAHHPVTGVGPGNFSWAYYDYKIVAETKSAAVGNLLVSTMNYGTAHNDHLQILAETGLPGYVLFLAALALVARVSFQSPSGVVRRDVARLMGLPL